MAIKNAAIIGMGALGLLYGSKIYKNIGKDAVSYILDDDRFESYKKKSFTVNGEEVFLPTVRADEALPYDLVIVAVKYNSLNSALETMKNCVGSNTVIISVMNGIDSEEIIARRYGEEKLLYAIAQGMDAMREKSALTYSKSGTVLLGITDKHKREKLDEVCEFFTTAKIEYSVPGDIMHALWGKFLLNVGVNQACMVFKTTYGGVLKEGEANRSMIAAMREVIAIARAEGVELTEKDLNFYVDIEKKLLPDSMPSMAQDGAAKRPSEVEMFAGTVIKIAKKHNILVPENTFLYKKVKEMEAEY